LRTFVGGASAVRFWGPFLFCCSSEHHSHLEERKTRNSNMVPF